ncbi:hypothetical protein K435DRAFT_878474 [Dendrothele bispora CBS 962.96]|uniref:Uncharacterized protein n=1 Tax=Dendrothele bispora (strain CBS 962.96) TaxID=1314807 RepID=A0A4S8KN46_DENBC|nr:hypothetical protein K435DRAFT_878474 [Dendrothele bispora CBS 962.96]
MPALWLYGSGGAFLITLGLSSLIGQWPRDKFEWGQILSRFLFGASIALLSVLNLNSSGDILTEDHHYAGSRIWFLAIHSWILPLYAFALLVERVIELVLLHLAHHHLEKSRNYTPIPV